MRSSAIILASLLLAACGSSDDGGPTGPTGTPTYNQVIQPMLAAKCDPCHTVEAAGGFNHAVDYGATQEPSEVCPGKMVYECMLFRVQNGSMPEDGDCSGDPSADAANDRCLTAAEQDKLAAWVAGGAPEGTGGQRADAGDTGDTGDRGW